MPEAKILIVLPTLGDRLDTLRETLESVNQQREDVALTLVLVAPPGATAARELGSTMGATVVDDPKHGISAAINCGLAVRTTEIYYAWVGDDDLIRPGGLARLLALIDKRDDVVVAFGGCDYIDPGGRTIAVSNAGRLALFLLPWGPDLVPNPATLIRLDALNKINGFDESLEYALDLDVFLTLRAYGKFLWTRESVSAFRWHPDSLTVANRRGSSLESETVKRKHLPPVLRPVSFIWSYPVRWASAIAANRVSSKARSL